MAHMGSVASEERRNWLRTQLRSSKIVTLAEAAAALGVSEMTVRRDLDRLEVAGIARRVHGGAVYSGPVSFHGREQSHTEEKRVIAGKLLSLVPESGVIAMDSSTTMNRLAQEITGSGDLLVVTNGMLTFQTLQERPGLTAILTGGASDRRSDSLVGPVATAFLEGMRFRVFFASAAAVNERASFEDTLEEAELKRAFARSSGQVILGVHSEKLGQDSTASAVSLERIGLLVTELDPGEKVLDEFRSVVGEVR
jgi:DeoR/GlpR family transcriptional regulator of sugar metabolism